MKKGKMILFVIVMISIIMGTYSICSSKPADAIVGKWERVGPIILVRAKVLDFSMDGTVIFDGERGTYKFVDDTHISIGDSEGSAIFEVQVSQDLLTFKDQFGNPQQFTRLK